MGSRTHTGRQALRAALALQVLLSAACASSGVAPRRADGGEAGRRSARSATTVVTSEELASLGVQSLYDAILRLRPEYFRTSPPTFTSPGGTPTMVYINGSRIGGMEALRTLTTGNVAQVKYLRPGEAQIRYREYLGAAIIDVTLERG